MATVEGHVVRKAPVGHKPGLNAATLARNRALHSSAMLSDRSVPDVVDLVRRVREEAATRG